MSEELKNIANEEVNTTIESGITLYELNKQIAAQEKEITKERLMKKADEIKNWVGEKYINNDETYFMLLNHEHRYFTLFSKKEETTILDFPYNVTSELIEVLLELGTLKDLYYNQNGDAYECWVDDSMYLFFPYTRGVIEC